MSLKIILRIPGKESERHKERKGWDRSWNMVNGCRRVRIYLVGASEGKRRKKSHVWKILINDGEVFPRSTERHETSDWNGSNWQVGSESKPHS